MRYNMAVYVVGDFLRETRIRKGYTQEEVSYGICTPASLSRIEMEYKNREELYWKNYLNA